ncbi:uncharacterized protein [Ranitomeya imitator]|uniref:uncharacterized protein n=1 Tax=Ranitomeya imitator TaxID=111125 RepID=UPI0037E7A66B
MVSLCFHRTHSSTREAVRPSGAVLCEAPSEQSQPSHSESRSAPPQSGEPAAGPSDVPLAKASVAPSFGSSRQRQRASDRAPMAEFLHLSTIFQNGFKALCDKMCNIERRLENIETDLSRPAKHFFNAIHNGMVEHLTPELQISVMQGCNNVYVSALQQARVMQSATNMPAVPSLAAMTPTPAAEHHHRAPRATATATTEQSPKVQSLTGLQGDTDGKPTHTQRERGGKRRRRRRQVLRPWLWLLPKVPPENTPGRPGAHQVPRLGLHGVHPVPSLGLQGVHHHSLGLPGAGVASQGHWSSLLLPHLLLC